MLTLAWCLSIGTKKRQRASRLQEATRACRARDPLLVIELSYYILIRSNFQKPSAWKTTLNAFFARWSRGVKWLPTVSPPDIDEFIDNVRRSATEVGSGLNTLPAPGTILNNTEVSQHFAVGIQSGMPIGLTQKRFRARSQFTAVNSRATLTATQSMAAY